MAPKKHRQKQKQIRQKPQIQSIKPKSNKMLWVAFVIITLVIIVVGAVVLSGQLNQSPMQPTKVLLETTAGNITIDLRTDKPITSGNFINLVNQGKYDGTEFHRTVSGFMIQGGKVNGQVSAINDEIGSNNRNTAYTIAMAKTNQPNSATSEFFINVEDNGQKYSNIDFDGTYTVFGTVTSGRDVVDAIANAPATENPYMQGEISVPVDPVIIVKATIIS